MLINFCPMQQTEKKESIKTVLKGMIPFGITFCILFFLFYIGKRAPFGNTSLACEDAYYQYMDFFAYYRDVLLGKQSIEFSMTTGLGMPNLALFSYYLSSPWNLLLIFFEKEDLHSFIDLIIALKLATAALTFSVFVEQRFENRMDSFLRIGLSVSYALMQYSIAQSCSTMWLDGVYMLPLIMLGVYRLVRTGNPGLLSVSVMLSILFNWYTAGINCLFAILWVVLEILFLPDYRETAKMQKIAIYIRFVCAMAIGVCMSAFLFLPTVYIMTKTPRGGLDFSIFANEWFGNVQNVISGYTLGAVSSRGELSVFCGGFVLVGVIAFFASREICIRKKTAVAVMLILTVMSCYWRPLFSIFSLFQDATSYYYRYSYIICFLLLFAASFFFSSGEKTVQGLAIRTGVAVLVYSVVIYVDYRLRGALELKYVIYTIAFQLMILMILCLRALSSGKQGKVVNIVFASLLLGIVALEMGYNSYLLMDKYSYLTDVEAFKQYETQEAALVDRIKEKDASGYRMTQTATRSLGINSSANLNESMAFGYNGVESYISSPIESQIRLLDKMGYTVYYNLIVEKMISMVSADSLLGVKYVLSPYAYEELKLREDLGEGNGKRVYENIYSMPISFKIGSCGDIRIESDDCVSFQNGLYEALFGEGITPLKTADYSVVEENGTRVYTIDLPEGKCSLYGDIAHEWISYADLDLNQKMTMGYGMIHSMGLFYIPVNISDRSAQVVLSPENMDGYYDASFYLVDLDVLERARDKAWDNAADDLVLDSNGNMSCRIEAHDGEGLFTSIPYVKGWTVYRNGEKVNISKVEDCFIIIPLTEGINTIEMKYHTPYVGTGVALSSIALLVLIAWNRYRWMGKRK